MDLSKDELEKTENRLESYNNDMSSIEEKKENFNLKREKLNDLKDFRVRFKSSKKDQEELNLHDNDIKELNKYIEKKELDHQLKGVLANEELQQNFKKIKDEVARLETSTAKLEKRLDTANMAYEKAEQDLSEMQAIHLSRKLIEGKPCPVCGSHNHPNPAKGLAESKGLNDAFESAKEERDTITVDHSNAKNLLANKKFQLGVLNKTLSDKETPLLSSKEIKVQISALGYEENEEYEQHDSKTLKNIRDQRNESRNRVIGRLDELLKGIPEELRNTEVIKRKIDDLEIKINDYDNEIKSLRSQKIKLGLTNEL